MKIILQRLLLIFISNIFFSVLPFANIAFCNGVSKLCCQIFSHTYLLNPNLSENKKKTGYFNQRLLMRKQDAITYKNIRYSHTHCYISRVAI